MAIDVKVITFDAPSVPPGPTVVQSITGVGFQPVLAYLFSTTSSDGSARASFSQGLDDAVTHVGRGTGLGVGVVRGNSGWASSSYSMLPVNNNGINTLLVGGKVNSFDADGLTLHWTSLSGFSSSQPVTHWIALLLGNISAKVGIKTGFGTGVNSVTGLGFQPTGLLSWSNAGVSANPGTSFGTGVANLGVSGGPDCTSQAAACLSAGSSGSVTDTKTLLTNGALTVDTSGVIDTIVTFDSDGFTFNAAQSGVGRYLAYAAVAGCAVNCDVFTLSGSTGTEVIPLIASFPKAALVFGIDQPSTVGTVNDLLWSVGAATASEQMGAWTGTLDGKSGSGFTHNRTDTTRLITIATPTGPSASTVVAQAVLTSFDPQRMTISKTLNDGIDREWIYIVFAEATGSMPCGVSATGSILVSKQCAPIGGGSTDFQFTTDGLTPATFSLQDGGSELFSGLSPGTYGVTESAIAGWTTTYSVSSGDPHTAIVISGADDITVTVTNTFISTTQNLLRLRRFALPWDGNKQIFIPRIEIIAQMGVGNSDDPNPVMYLRISPDGGETWGPFRQMPLGASGDTMVRAYLTRFGQLRNPVAELVCGAPVFVAWVACELPQDFTVGSS